MDGDSHSFPLQNLHTNVIFNSHNHPPRKTDTNVVFKYTAVDDKVSVDDPLLVTEFNDQCLGRKITKTTRVMDYVQIAWKPSFHFKVEARRCC